MRCVAGAGLLALVGCNQVFGISETRGYDASINDVPPVLPRVALTFQIAGVLDTGAPDQTLAFPAISPAPQVRVATLEGGFAPAEYEVDGRVAFPIDYVPTTWRLEYTLADGIPHEVQWSPTDGRLTVPLFGRTDRSAIPTGSGYQITPTGIVMPYTFPRVLTTGLWTDGAVEPPSDSSSRTVDYDFASAQSLSGTRGRPESARGDRAFFVDNVVNNEGCRVAIGAAEFSPDLQAGTHSVVAPGWDTRTAPVESSPIGLDQIQRLQTALGDLRGPGIAGVSMIGPVPSATMPGLTRSSSGFLLPFPTMQALAQCPYQTYPPSSVLLPLAFESFAFAAHVQLSSTRTIADLGLLLSSGMATSVLASSGIQPDAFSFVVEFPAAIPTQLRLTRLQDNAVTDLSGGADHASIGDAAAAFELSFVPELAPKVRADYYDVILHKVVSTALSTVLTTERIYTATTARVRIDNSVLEPSTEYVLEIRAYRGHPDASKGDFQRVEYPYGVAVVFTRTFKTS